MHSAQLNYCFLSITHFMKGRKEARRLIQANIEYAGVHFHSKHVFVFVTFGHIVMDYRMKKAKLNSVDSSSQKLVRVSEQLFYH